MAFKKKNNTKTLVKGIELSEILDNYEKIDHSNPYKFYASDIYVGKSAYGDFAIFICDDTKKYAYVTKTDIDSVKECIDDMVNYMKSNNCIEFHFVQKIAKSGNKYYITEF